MQKEITMITNVFENEHLIIRHHENDGYLSLKWTGSPEGEHFKSLANHVIEAIEKTGITRILSDNTDWKAIAPNDQAWAATRWFPKAEEKGVRKLATVLSTDLFNRIAERSIEGIADVDCVQIQNFTSHVDALSWLTRQEHMSACEHQNN